MAQIIKRINSTGRRRISQENVTIEVYENPNRHFQAAMNLDSYNFPKDASIVLDLFCAGSSKSKRFYFGTFENPQDPDCSLADIEAEHIYFTLKIIDQSNSTGRILGVADNIRPQNVDKKTGKDGLLPVEYTDLNEVLWKLDFPKSGGVFLLVNKNYQAFTERLNTPFIVAILLPELLRQILDRILSDYIGEEEGWRQQWLKFGQNLHPDQMEPPVSESDRDIQPSEKDEWIEPIVEHFSKDCSLLNNFSEYFSQKEAN